MAARNMYRIEINIHEKLCSSWLFTKIIPGCTVNKMQETLKLKATRQLLVYVNIGWKHTYHREGTEASAVPNTDTGKEVNAEKTGNTFMLHDQNSGKFTTQRYVINRLK